jgi:hypothetical protein
MTIPSLGETQVVPGLKLAAALADVVEGSEPRDTGENCNPITDRRSMAVPIRDARAVRGIRPVNMFEVQFLPFTQVQIVLVRGFLAALH